MTLPLASPVIIFPVIDEPFYEGSGLGKREFRGSFSLQVGRTLNATTCNSGIAIDFNRNQSR